MKEAQRPVAREATLLIAGCVWPSIMSDKGTLNNTPIQAALFRLSTSLCQAYS